MVAVDLASVAVRCSRMPHRHIAAAVLFGLVLCANAAAQEQLLREAARLDAEQKCVEAENIYQQVLAKGTPSAALLNNLGNHYLVCGQPEKARSSFEQLLKINPAHTNANLQLARMATEQKQGAKALAYLARVNDSGPMTGLLRAEALYWAGRRDAAKTQLAAVEKQAGSDSQLLFLLGLTSARIGQYDRAEKVFSALLSLHPNDFDLLVNLGRAAARARHYDRARQAFEVALKVKPDDVDALFELGLVHAAEQDFVRGAYLLVEATRRAPQRADILLALARVAEDAGYYGDSALAYDRYLQLRPADDTVRRDRARVYAYTETRLEEGLKEMAWYVQKHPDDPVGYFNQAQFSWRTNPEKALEQLSAAVRLDPNFAAARYSRAWLLHRLGRTAESLPDLQTTVKLEPKNVRALDQLGLAYLTLDQAAEAEKALRRALASAPDDPEVLMHLGRAVMALGREDEAQQYLDKFRQVRPKRIRDPRKEPWMIESASLSVAERTRREIERFRRDAADHPEDSELRLHLAVLLLSDGRSDEALGEFRKLLSGNAEGRTWEEAGTALVRVGEYQLARQFLERAVKERPAARLDLAIAIFFGEGPKQALNVLEEVPERERNGDYLLMKARILDAAGESAAAERLLSQGLRQATYRPQVAQQGALLLLRLGRKTDALDVLNRSIESAPDNPDLLLTRAAVLALSDRYPDAEKSLNEIESRWPEWDRVYLAHGLVMERNARKREAAQKLRTAVALGSKDPAAACALARLAGAPPKGPQCACVPRLQEWLLSSCAQN